MLLDSLNVTAPAFENAWVGIRLCANHTDVNVTALYQVIGRFKRTALVVCYDCVKAITWRVCIDQNGRRADLL